MRAFFFDLNQRAREPQYMLHQSCFRSLAPAGWRVNVPLVFVHGVSNRNTPQYRDNQFARDAFMRTFVVPALGLARENFQIFNPYWGDDGATFRWENASLPETVSDIDTFGALDSTDLRIAADVLAVASPDAPDIVAVARRSLAEAIDIIWSAALPFAASSKEANALAESYNQARLYVASNTRPEWLTAAKSGNFVDQLLFDLETRSAAAKESASGGTHAQWDSFGSDVGLGDCLRESLERITSLPASAMSAAVLTLGRKNTHLCAAQFLGDVFQYLDKRGNKNAPGPIVKKVLNGFRIARNASVLLDSKLIVVGHSLGGVISYDILTHFDPSIEVDVLVTVGSQVALFEEMALYRASQPTSVPNPATDRVPRPRNVKRWLNVVDPNDVFSFRTEGVFEGVKDFRYQTGYGAMSAHSGYFRRPSFYVRLGDRLARGDQ
jgi:hypothetical protein